MNKGFAIGILMCLLVLSAQVQAETLRVAVASNFAATLELIKQRFEKQNPHAIVIIKGSTGKLYAQIKHGAPYDVFMAADVARPRLLEQDDMIADNSRFTYAIGQLVLWSTKQPDNILEVLKTGKYKKLAIANPKIAPYGKASIEVMQYLNVYQQSKPKLVYGENVAQAMHFIQSGSAELGFVPLSLVKPLTTSYWIAVDNAHHKLEQQLVILKSSSVLSLATSFVDFIKRDDIKALIKAQGYDTL